MLERPVHVVAERELNPKLRMEEEEVEEEIKLTECRLRLFENRILRRIFRPKRDGNG